MINLYASMDKTINQYLYKSRSYSIFEENDMGTIRYSLMGMGILVFKYVFSIFKPLLTTFKTRVLDAVPLAHLTDILDVASKKDFSKYCSPNSKVSVAFPVTSMPYPILFSCFVSGIDSLSNGWIREKLSSSLSLL